jgi:copper chaperone CopZ
MTHTYNISGMTCTGCQAKVHVLLSKIPYVTNVEISLAEGTADISMSEHIATPTLQDALKCSAGIYRCQRRATHLDRNL